MANINYDSNYSLYTNRSIDWFLCDTKARYETNLKKNYALMENHGWVNSAFKYSFNSHGFRCDEFSDEPTIMFLGGSVTMGLGLPIETVWSSLLAKELNMNSANLAICGSGGDTAFRLCHGWIDKIKPKIVIFLEPTGFRMEVVLNNSSIKLVNAHKLNRYATFAKDWIMDDTNMYLNSQKNQLGIKSICDSRNIKYLHITDNDFLNCAESSGLDLARDLTHPGKKINQEFVKHMLSQLGTQ